MKRTLTLFILMFSSYSLLFSQNTDSLTTGTFIDERDGQEYKWVKIGKQIWMAENLNYMIECYVPLDAGILVRFRFDTLAKAPDGVGWILPLDDGKTVQIRFDTTVKEPYKGENIWVANDGKIRRSFYDTAYKISIGMPYSWNCDICPKGWHLPNDAEWLELINYLGGMKVAGGSLKETGTLYWHEPNKGATNLSGFSAIPNLRNRTGKSLTAEFWSATESSAGAAYTWRMASYNKRVRRRQLAKWIDGPKIRCVKD